MANAKPKPKLVISIRKPTLFVLKNQYAPAASATARIIVPARFRLVISLLPMWIGWACPVPILVVLSSSQCTSIANTLPIETVIVI
jgi:hypothetical protein